MKCPECGEAMEVRKETRRGFSGLPDVVVEDVDVRNCPACGETEESYQSLSGLIATIAQGLAGKQSQLTPQEVRFLRSYLGLSTDDLARRMGVTRDSVTRWERTTGEQTTMGPTAERLLRLMAVRDKPVSAYPMERLDDVANSPPTPIGIRVAHTKGGWKLRLAA